jgi:hypothetical protein
MPTYIKGQGQLDDDGKHTGLRNRALEQSIGEMDITRKMTSSEKFEREKASGVQGAKNAVNLNATVSEATANPDMLGGPVSGAALAKLKAKKSEAKRTAEREKKRR